MSELRSAIKKAIQGFASGKPLEQGRRLLNALGYQSKTTAAITPNTWQGFKAQFVDGSRPFIEATARVKEWQTVDLIFQLGEEDLKQQNSLFTGGRFDNKAIYSYVFFAITLAGKSYSRTDLARITRELNRLFDMPAMIFFRYGDSLTIASIDRRLHKLDETKDVLEKVTLIKDVNVVEPNRAHIDILHDLSLPELTLSHKVETFVSLHNAWRAVLDISALNKRFYREIADWYFWAVKEVQFPLPPTNKLAADPTNNSICVIRLLTRLIFAWFLKEKGLVPDNLFDEKELAKILVSAKKSSTLPLQGKDSTYYRAIIQNLFFATLNAEMNRDIPGNRRFVQAESGDINKQKTEYGIKNIFRYADLFSISKEEAIKLFDDIPFLNGGLFDCLDKEDDNGKVIYLDGFTRNPKLQPIVPDFLFFADYQTIDLSNDYGDKKWAQEKVRGLIRILRDYKFTVAENTPIEEEVALDPELLGNVFENLLASYDPNTGVTARKQTGSFYTPRMIVNYMVDESLKAYLLRKLLEKPTFYMSVDGNQGDMFGNKCKKGQLGLMEEHGSATNTTTRSSLEERLSTLIAWNDLPNPFSPEESAILIEAIHSLKTLDPAVGSGAFPMGLLHKMVHILHKLDPDNTRWKQAQLEAADRLTDPAIRHDLIAHIEDVFDPSSNQADYGRKLFLIQNCIYGIDIQPIAVQIAKLRFFISLVVDQKVNNAKKNRGVLSLPNLETRFVAANTLMGIDKPVIDDLFGGDIRKKEAELKQVRSRHFDARTRTEKLKCMADDKRIRGEIAGLLEKDNYPHDKAVRLSSWNPYDQNISADFFDAEWMFGILEGFDIAIGNPPYLFARNSEAKGMTAEAKSYFKANYSLSEYQVNLYPLFIERGDRLLVPRGILSYITPNNWLTINTNKTLRQFVLDRSNIQIVNYYTKVFESASVDSAIVLYEKGKHHQHVRLLEYTDTLHEIKSAPVSFFASQRESVINVENFKGDDDLHSVMTKIENISMPLKHIADVKTGLVAYEVGKGTPPQTKSIKESRIYHSMTKKNQDWMEYLQGSDVSRYSMIWSGEYILYGENLAAPRKDPCLYSTKRILVRQIPNKLPYCIHACYTDREIYNDRNSMNVINIKANPMAILAILNSRLISFWFVLKFGKLQRGLFPQFKANELADFPISKKLPQYEKQLAELAKKATNSRLKNATADIADIDNEIDRLVYSLYGLTDDEIAVVEGKAC